MIANISYIQAEEIKEKLEELPGVFMVTFDDTQDHYNNGSARFDITFDHDEKDELCLTYLDGVKDLIAPYDHYLSRHG